MRTLVDFPAYQAEVVTEGPVVVRYPDYIHACLYYVVREQNRLGAGETWKECSEDALHTHLYRSLFDILEAPYFSDPPQQPDHTYRYVDFGND